MDNELQLPDMLQRYVADWDLFAAVLLPWLCPPAGDFKTKMKVLEHNQQRIDEWMQHRRELGLRETSYYLYWLVCHSEEAFEHWLVMIEEELVDFAIQEVNCELGEHVNKQQKGELAPLMPMLRNEDKNAFYYMMRDWQVRLAHFPDTTHVRRIEMCSSCGALGHRCSSRMCPNYQEWLESKQRREHPPADQEPALARPCVPFWTPRGERPDAGASASLL